MRDKNWYVIFDNYTMRFKNHFFLNFFSPKLIEYVYYLISSDTYSIAHFMQNNILTRWHAPTQKYAGLTKTWIRRGGSIE